MADTNYSQVKGGGIRNFRLGSECSSTCSACTSTLPVMPRKVNDHDAGSFRPLWATYDPQFDLLPRTCVQEDEIAATPGATPQVPAGYVMWTLAIPAHTIIHGMGVNHSPTSDPYGLANASFAGLAYDVVANYVDDTACPPVIGAAVPAAIPAALVGLTDASVVAAGGTITASQATANGFVVGAQPIIISLKITTPPAGGLSNLKGGITLQANVETFHALVR